MKLSRLLPLLALVWAPACAIYNEGLLDNEDDDTVEASGGKPSNSGGKSSSSGGSLATGGRTASGGVASGGTVTTGGRTASGGEGGEPPSGTGGTSSGGSSGGAPSGGASTGGAPGTGGVPAVGPFLVTDMSRSTHSNSPFFGKIDRYSQEETTWAASTISNMLVPREAESSDLALHVAASFGVEDWGVDIVVTLKSGQAFDLSPYTTLSFELKGIDLGSPVRVGLEDYASHRGSTLCSGAGVGDDCDQHVEALAQWVPEAAWETIELDLDDTTFEGCGLGCERDNPLDLTQVYAIHFKMDPLDEEDVDFWVDNIYIDN